LVRYIALGRSPRDSRPLLKRYKSPHEIRDIFVLDGLRLRSGEIYYFYEASESWMPIAFYLISFDIEGHESKAYSIIKEDMMFNACAYVDLSTYVCPHEVEIPEADRVEAFWVRPLGKAREYLKERFIDTFEFLIDTLAKMVDKVENADRRANRLRRVAERRLATVPVVISIFKRYKEKFESIDLKVEDVIENIESSAEELRKALHKKWGQGKSV